MRHRASAPTSEDEPAAARNNNAGQPMYLSKVVEAEAKAARAVPLCLGPFLETRQQEGVVVSSFFMTCQN